MRFMKHVGVASWFSQLCKVQPDFVSRERIVCIDIEGVPLHAWSRSTFSKIGSHWGEVIELEDNEEDCFARKHIYIKTKLEDNIFEKFKIIVRAKFFVIRAKELFVWSPTFNDNKEVDDYYEDDFVNVFDDKADSLGHEHTQNLSPNEKENSRDPFNLYNLLNKRDKGEANSGLDSSIPFPPGFTPEREFQHVDVHEVQGMENSLSKRSSEGGSILEVIDDVIKVDQSMRFSMEGCLGSKAKKDWIKELNNKHKVNFLSVQETKLDCISDMDVKVLWGNYKFEYTISEAVGNSGGILCVWDPSVFRKEHHVVSDNFVALYGSWVSNQAKLLVVSIYAPQSITSKRSLWSYISSLISRWDGHCMVMGDFNEVRCMEDRLGSVYNAQGANEFNSFISNSGLVEIQLEGWKCWKSSDSPETEVRMLCWMAVERYKSPWDQTGFFLELLDPIYNIVGVLVSDLVFRFAPLAQEILALVLQLCWIARISSVCVGLGVACSTRFSHRMASPLAQPLQDVEIRLSRLRAQTAVFAKVKVFSTRRELAKDNSSRNLFVR
ncbi:RNA-directed DNA polymerase, eukaryota [Tanacetum coccineum]